jgi:hypothetical protein
MIALTIGLSYITIGLLIGKIYKSKIIQIYEDYSSAFTEENSIEFLAKIQRAYLFFWVPLFFIDYFSFYRKTKQ